MKEYRTLLLGELKFFVQHDRKSITFLTESVLEAFEETPQTLMRILFPLKTRLLNFRFLRLPMWLSESELVAFAKALADCNPKAHSIALFYDLCQNVEILADNTIEMMLLEEFNQVTFDEELSLILQLKKNLAKRSREGI